MKAPRAAELYARGVEICDPDLRVETAWSLDASVPIRRNRLGATATLFTSRFSDFIFLRNTSEVEHGFPVRHVSQGDAIFKGFEAETDFEMFHAGDRHLSLRLWSDLTLAERVEDAEPLPRIPPLRVGGGRGSAGVGGGLNYTHGPVKCQRVGEECRAPVEGGFLRRRDPRLHDGGRHGQIPRLHPLDGV